MGTVATECPQALMSHLHQNFLGVPGTADAYNILDAGLMSAGMTQIYISGYQQESLTKQDDLKRACQICSASLQNLRSYHQRYKICDVCMNKSHVELNGKHQRFCQQCGRFQDVKLFNGNNRSCKERLQKHAERRRKAMAEKAERARHNGGAGRRSDTVPSPYAMPLPSHHQHQAQYQGFAPLQPSPFSLNPDRSHSLPLPMAAPWMTHPTGSTNPQMNPMLVHPTATRPTAMQMPMTLPATSIPTLHRTTPTGLTANESNGLSSALLAAVEALETCESGGGAVGGMATLRSGSPRQLPHLGSASQSGDLEALLGLLQNLVGALEGSISGQNNNNNSATAGLTKPKAYRAGQGDMQGLLSSLGV